MNLAFFGLEFCLVSALLLGAYRLKSRLGMSAVVAVVAAMQPFQAVLAASYFWPVGDGLYINPASSILFAGNLSILLYAFARDGVIQARTVLYAVLLGNLVPSALGALLSWHASVVEPMKLMELPPQLFERGLIASIVGIILLYFDQILAVLSFNWLRRKLPTVPIAVHLSVALSATLAFDTIAFLSILFWDSPNYEQFLVSGLVSKTLGGLAFGIAWGAYLQNHHAPENSSSRQLLDVLLFQENLSELREAATTDPMTGLLNRRTYNLMVGKLLQRQAGASSDRFSIVLIDADRFKQINDTLGHAEGDRVLEQIAATVRQAIREGDHAFRLGGDEFLVLLPDSGLEQAQDVARRLSRFEFDHPDLDHPVTLTIGISAYPDDGVTRDELFDAADRRLYDGKTSGRNRIVTGKNKAI
ncbi:GGDEF domain-containing protein [Persicimonas caeni]|uniref:GGDEF domain-containing protein n=1 Tax=Persicimonas caeni TaxID=2292766 RepID=A0A4Y6PMS9_PERCE|nr:GGDEF domain-containing protein [Persicimonas caeni]QDG49592.1 GGDEF domain-containing protein [Persicimonas caeni]QED30813.1 GGDEF domain-containing protein [Persicimonas caeni]